MIGPASDQIATLPADIDGCRLCRTTAPVNYDGFGTRTVSRDGAVRVVAIQPDHVVWQISRYASGLHGWAHPDPGVQGG